MNITNLPPEILMIVINYLDTKSKVNLYNTSLKVRNFFVPNHVKKINLSRSILANIHCLKQDLFLDLAKHILELNLSGVQNITVDEFQPYANKFENLITLDVTYTNIYLSDLEKICPSGLRNISINFFKSATGCYKQYEIWNRAKQVFFEHQFINVRFIVFDILNSSFPLLFLNELPLIEHFEVDIIDKEKYCERRYSFDNKQEITNMNFSRLRYLFRDCHVGNIKDMVLKIDFDKVEYIFVMYSNKIMVYVSPVFEKFFSTNSIVTVKVEKVLPSHVVIIENVIFLAWNKNTNIFDDKLFKSITEYCKDYFPIYICMHNMLKTNIINVQTNWYCLDKCDGFEKLMENEPEKLTLTNHCRLGYNVTNMISLSEFHEWDRIRNITFLSISNLSFGDQFFSHLFANCKRIVTLDVHICNTKNDLRDFMAPLLNSILQTNSLRNLKITTEYTDYDILFKALSKCSNLENIHICDFVRAFDYININPGNINALLENCKNLYSLFIEADTSPQASTILYSNIYEVVQRMELFHLFVDVNSLLYALNPFVDVFNPSPLQIVD